jgi:AcrR family transcriptional regulator
MAIQEKQQGPRIPLSRERVLRAAIALADEHGIEELSMRKLGQELGVEAMSLYNHVANKEDVLDGMVDLVVGEFEVPPSGTDWKTALRERVLSARRALLRHPWASRVMESRTQPTPTMLAYMDSVIGIFRTGGFSVDLTHHALHTMGSRMLGFTQELYDDSGGDLGPELEALMLQEMAEKYPYISELATAISHDENTIVGQGCDDQFEFEFGLDLILDGLERLRNQMDHR